MAGVGITDAIVIAMKEAVARRRDAETQLETAARLRRKHGIELGAAARKPLPRAAWDGDVGHGLMFVGASAIERKRERRSCQARRAQQDGGEDDEGGQFACAMALWK